MKHVWQIMGWAAFAAVLAGCEQRSAPDPGSQRSGDDSILSQASGASADSARALASDSVLTPEGWHDLRIGMTRAEVVAAAGEDAHPEAVGGPDPSTCDEFRPIRAPDGLLVMIRDGRLTRISITEGPEIVTGEGIAVGDSISAVREAYGSTAVSSPHAYHAAPARYLTVWQVRPPSPSARGIVYEVAGTGRVLRILAGDESIEYPEGCL